MSIAGILDQLRYFVVATKLEQTAVKSSIRKLGNSHGAIIPKTLLAEIGAKADDPVNIKVKKSRIVIEPVKMKRKPRAGWVAVGAKIAEAGDGELVWPELTNDFDEDWTW